jgi:hypothetical protein
MAGLDMLDGVSLGIDSAHHIDLPPPPSAGSDAGWMQALNEAGLGRNGGSTAAVDGTAPGGGYARLMLAQAEEPQEEEPAEEEPGREFEHRDPTDEELRNAELSSDPAVRWRAYEAGKRELAKVDPQSPNAGADISSPEWAPSGRDIERVRNDIADAKTAKSLGLTPEEYRDLARDPAHGGQIRANGRQERDAAIMAWKAGQISGPPTRSPDPRADFRDADGRDWDVKSFNSRYPDGFSLPGSADKVDEELNKGEHVIVNTENMSTSDVAALKAEGARRGWSDRVIYTNANPLGSALQMPGAR